MCTIRGVALLVVALTLAVACVFPDRGTRIANELRDYGHPLIAVVEYNADDDSSGPLLTVLLRPGATQAEAETLTCEVIVPANRRGSPPETFVFDVLDSTGLGLLASEATACP